MPVGVDLERFGDRELGGTAPNARESMPGSILFLARMAPSKRPEMLLEALALLQQKGVLFTAAFVGSPLPEHREFYERLKERARAQDPHSQISFLQGIPNTEAPAVFRRYEIFVNASRSGMFDKTLFEAAASGCFVLASSEDFRDSAGIQQYFSNANELADRLIFALARTDDDWVRDRTHMLMLARKENLATLADRLVYELNS